MADENITVGELVQAAADALSIVQDLQAEIERIESDNRALRRGCRIAMNSLLGAPADCLGIRGGIEQGIPQWYVRDTVIGSLGAALRVEADDG